MKALFLLLIRVAELRSWRRLKNRPTPYGERRLKDMPELIERLKRIKTKLTLNLPLTAHEQALWTIYGARLMEAEKV